MWPDALFFAALGFHWVIFVRAFSSCGEWRLLFIAVPRLLTTVASLWQGLAAPGTQNLSRPGTKPMCPELAGGSPFHCTATLIIAF